MKSSVAFEYAKAIPAAFLRVAGSVALSVALSFAFLAFQQGDVASTWALVQSWVAKLAASAAAHGDTLETWLWRGLAFLIVLIVVCPLAGFLVTRWRMPRLSESALVADQRESLTVALDAAALLPLAHAVLATNPTLRDVVTDAARHRVTARSAPFSNRSSWWATPRNAIIEKQVPHDRGWLREFLCRLDLPFIGGPRREVSVDIVEAAAGGSAITIRSHFRTWLPIVDPFATNRLAVADIADAIAARVPPLVAERRAAAERAQIEARLTDARLQVLRAQIEPHFLYNTLANVQYLIRHDAAAADAMVTELIAYLRQSLPKMRDAKSTIGGELALARAYLNVMRIRMGGRLSITIDAPESLVDHAFPPMMLMSLVENAIKHGLEPKTGAGEIRISVTAKGARLQVAVADDGVGFGTAGGSGIGLKNIRETLASLFGARARLAVEPNADAGVTALIDIPLDGDAMRQPASQAAS